MMYRIQDTVMLVRPHSKDISTCTAPNLDVYIHILNRGLQPTRHSMIIPAVSYDLRIFVSLRKASKEVR